MERTVGDASEDTFVTLVGKTYTYTAVALVTCCCWIRIQIGLGFSDIKRREKFISFVLQFFMKVMELRASNVSWVCHNLISIFGRQTSRLCTILRYTQQVWSVQDFVVILPASFLLVAQNLNNATTGSGVRNSTLTTHFIYTCGLQKALWRIYAGKTFKSNIILCS